MFPGVLDGCSITFSLDCVGKRGACRRANKALRVVGKIVTERHYLPIDMKQQGIIDDHVLTMSGSGLVR